MADRKGGERIARDGRDVDRAHPFRLDQSDPFWPLSLVVGARQLRYVPAKSERAATR